MNLAPGIKTDFDLSSYNSLSVPSRTRYFTEVHSIETLNEAVLWAKQNRIPVGLIGAGSNTLLSDNIEGLVIKLNLVGKSALRQDDTHVYVLAAAGENWHEFVLWSLDNNYYGLENLALIPGNVGAAPIQNIGAYGVEISTFIHAVHTVDLRSAEQRTMTLPECAFSYRHSMFKLKQNQHLAITHVEFRLSKTPQLVLNYPSLQRYLRHNNKVGADLEPHSLAQVIMQIRSEKLPVPAILPNAGSFFTNPIVDLPCVDMLKRQFPDIVSFDVLDKFNEPKKKIAAGWLIEKAGWKKRAIGGVRVHEHQALVLINPHRKPLRSIMHFSNALKTDIKDRFGIDLQIEPQELTLKTL